MPEIADKLKRHDFYQTLYLASITYNLPNALTSMLHTLSNERLDEVSYRWAKESDFFIYYRTQGLKSTKKLHAAGSSTVCIMEEVNSHIEFANDILLNEFISLGLKKGYEKEPDFNLRLQTYDETDYILCPSEFVRKSFLSKGFAPERLLKVNFGFPAIEAIGRDFTRTGSDTFTMLYVGQLHYRKGLRYAIEAFKKLKHPKKEFIIVGPKTPVTGLENTQIPSGVIFTGPLKGEDLKNQYKKASVFVLPSLEEGLALVQGEALAFGIPLIITTNTGGDDIIEDGIEGFIVPPAQIDKLAEKLQLMADDSDLRNSMSVNALKAAQKLGSWDVAASRLITELTSIKDVKKSFEKI